MVIIWKWLKERILGYITKLVDLAREFRKKRNVELYISLDMYVCTPST